MPHWVDIEGVDKTCKALGRTSDHDFHVECISAPYFSGDVAKVVYCDECINHGQCSVEDTFQQVNKMASYRWFCCLGEKKE